MILVFKEFLQTQFLYWFLYFIQKGITIFRRKICRLTVPNHFVEEPFCVLENFGYRKILCLRGKYHDFLWKICCLTVPKNFAGEPFCVSQNFWYRKILWIRGGGSITIFCQFFCLTVPKKFVGEPLSVSLISGIEKFYAWEGYVTILYRKFVVSQCPKNFVEESFCAVFQKISGSEKVYG